MTGKRKPILCLDFDGVLHSYWSGWKGADVISDLPVAGAIDFLIEAERHFEVNVFSSRSHQEGGIFAMQQWLEKWMIAEKPDVSEDIIRDFVGFVLKWPEHKPPATITLDDRAMQFTGEWPTLETLQNFKPWNKLGQNDD